jgi:hypothetical protein
LELCNPHDRAVHALGEQKKRKSRTLPDYAGGIEQSV